MSTELALTDRAGKSESISAIIAKACAEYGVTPGQIAGLANTLSKLRTGPVHGDWEGAARMLSRQQVFETEKEETPPEWTRPIKLGAREAMAALEPLLPDLCDLGSPDGGKALADCEGSDDGQVDLALRRLGAIERMPEPLAPQFHLIGTVLHAVASTGSRRGMWALAHHLRGYSTHPDTDERSARSFIATARQWEALALRTRTLAADWSNPAALPPVADRWTSADTWLKRIGGRLEMLLKDPRYTLPDWMAEVTMGSQASGSDLEEGTIGLAQMVVLDRIGGIPEHEDDTSVWAKTKPWRMLLKPLPVVGRFDPDETYRILRLEFPWMDEANRRAAEMVAGVRAGRPRIGPLLLTGEPGIGKTAWAARLAELCELPYTRVSVTTGSGMMIAGDEREWSSSAPSLPAKIARDLGVANPMIILDELDKSPAMGASANASNVHDALLPILDVNERRGYYDIFLQGKMNLARFSWVLLANGLEGMSAPLLDRLTVVHARRPTVAEIDRRLDEMIAAWLPGETVEPGVRRRALARFEETLSLRDVRGLVEQASLQSLWRAPGPRDVAELEKAEL